MKNFSKEWKMCVVVTQLLAAVRLVPPGVSKMLTHQTFSCKEWLAKTNQLVDQTIADGGKSNVTKMPKV